jgi:hypothetical protein
MAGFTDVFQWATVSGDPTTIGDVTITPQSQALTIRTPLGGFVWNRPVAILVERMHGAERIPIPDVSRLALWSLLGLSMAFSAIAALRSTRRRRNGNE